MIIHSLKILNAGRIAEFCLPELSDVGAVVIEGENEAGKSTVMEMIRLGLEAAHKANTKHVRALKPNGHDESPQITMEFSLGKHRLHMNKVWLRGKKHELKAIAGPLAGRAWTGEEADSMLKELLSGESHDADLLDALFVRQNELSPELEAAGIPSLNSILGQGDSEALEEDHELMAKVKSLYEATFTKRGAYSSRSDVQKAIDELEDAQEQQADARAALRDVERRVEFVEKNKPRLLQWHAQLPERQAEFEDAQAQHEQVRELEREFAGLQERYDDAKSLLKAAVEQVERREEARETLKILRGDVESAEATLAAKAERREAEEAKYADVLAELDRTRSDITAMQQRLDQATAAQAQQVAKEEFERIAQTLDQVQVVQAEREQCLSVPQVTQAMLDRVQEADAALRSAVALNQSQSPSLTLSADQEREVFIDGEVCSVRDAVGFAVTEAMDLDVGGVHIRVLPGVGAEASAQKVLEAKRALKDAIAGTPAKDLDHLRVLRRECAEAEQQAQVLEVKLASLLGGEDVQSLQRRQAELKLQLADEIAPPEDADVEELREQLNAREEQEAELVERREVLQPRPATREYEAALLQRDHVKQQFTSAESSLAQELEQCPTEQLKQQKAKRQATVEGLEQHIATSRVRLEQVGVDQVSMQFDMAKAALENLKEKINRTSVELEVNQQEIDAQVGVAEAAQEAERRLQVAKSRSEKLMREADALKLLYDVLMKHRDEARERYSRPLGQQLSQLAPFIFGEDVSFTFDENLKVQARKGEEGVIPVEKLSAGAKEQLGLLIRLALARIVAQGDTSLILDDPLGASDPVRIGGMNGLLGVLAKQHQLIIMTCQPERFSMLSGRQAYAMEKVTKYY
ncbi:AAA family ATPase [Corynebacterium gerontici]|uniref:Chromosome partition protein Smc n=1 Tax=Corynebacterium gerontici TaxID=2079234 RepID=A0A3G6IZJ6_9CORY|nr:hypothetical protein [Corynebacterium gerontici]AZA11205.1 Chromosome partition protein Smc [Corynebacterium gerontici]